ncbi:MAG: OmpH family outer membrane protein [Tannerella sp.]|jgi:outer membrane protein|nr:OmpH family outer membrane protein [Tannerella sp.]
MKKFIVPMLLILPLWLSAQEIKIAVVNAQAVMNAMPEVSDMESQLATLQQQFQKEAKIMEDEYNRKYSDLQAQGDSLTENIRILRLQEIQDIATRMENFAPMAREQITKKQDELLAPIQEKIMKAIKEVGEENGYTYVLNYGVLYHIGPNGIDATDKVKAKLGIK